MPHKPPIKSGESIDRYLARVQAKHAGNGNDLPEGIEGTPIVVNGQTIGWNIGGEFFTQEEVDALIATGKFPEEPSGPGRAPPAFSSTRAAAELAFQQDQILLEQRHQNDLAILERNLAQATADRKLQIQADIDLENIRHQNDLKELRLQFENQLKGQLIGEIGAERRTLIQEKGAARRQQAEFAGRRPFRFAFNIRGEQPSAPTPFDIQSAQNLAFINQALPTASLNAPISQLESTLTGLQNIQAPEPGLFGLAHGGVIEMEKGPSGAFSQKQSFLVGENPDGTINETTEILTVGSGRLEVTPLAGGAQGGLEFPFPQGGLEESLVQTAAQSLTGGVPLEQAIAAATKRLKEVRPTIDALAVQAWAQRVRDFLTTPPPPAGNLPPIPFPELGSPTFAESIFLPFPQGGLEESLAKTAVGQVAAGVPIDIAVRTAVQRLNEVRPGNPAAMFQWGQRLKNAIQAAPTRASVAPLADLPFLQMIQRPNQGFQNLSLTTGLQDIGLSPFQANELAGRFTLPDPGKFARTFTQELEPTEQGLTRELFELAGVPTESFDFQIRQATPTGRFFNPQRLGFTGRAI